MANSYITITESGGLSKRFKAIQMQPNIKLSKTIEETVGGGYDISYGQNYESYSYLLRIPYAVSDTNYGTYKEFLQMTRRNNPSGTPPPTFTLTDHYGTTHTTATFGMPNVAIEPLTVIIDGSTPAASYLVKATILLYPGDKIVPYP